MKRTIVIVLCVLSLSVFLPMVGCSLNPADSGTQTPTQSLDAQTAVTASKSGDIAYQGYRNVGALCTGGSIIVKAYLNGALVNTVSLSSGQSYNFYHSSSTLLTLRIYWPNGGWYSLYYC